MILSRTLAPAAAVGLTSLLLISGCTNVMVAGRPQWSDTAEGANSPDPKFGMAAVIGVDLGAGEGYLVGASREKIQHKQAAEARAAAERSRISPATLADARRSDTADLNGDGFVTVDEVLAMQKASLSDREIIDRLQRTGQVFILTEQQQDYLRDRGISQRVIDAMTAMDGGYRQVAGATTSAGLAR